jgi:hypothetical protein
MATIKSYTDISQSKKLAEILPLESADMRYGYIAPYDYSDRMYDGGYDEIPYPKDFLIKNPNFSANEYDAELPCWSLAALLNLLPNEIITDNRFECHYQIHIRKYDGGDNTTFYQIAYGNNRGSSGSWHDMINTGEKENLIDCCVQMIINLREKDLL